MTTQPTLVVCANALEMARLKKSLPSSYNVVTVGSSLHGHRYDHIMVTPTVNRHDDFFRTQVRPRLSSPDALIHLIAECHG